MLGHHDDTVYGIGWEGEEGRSDVKSVCGDYPAVISFDLGELELGNAANLDKVPFDKIRKEIINQYQRGGMVSLSWHARNPKTGGDAWDVSDTTVVKSILPGGENHQKFAGWLGGVADFLHSLKTADLRRRYRKHIFSPSPLTERISDMVGEAGHFRLYTGCLCKNKTASSGNVPERNCPTSRRRMERTNGQ